MCVCSPRTPGHHGRGTRANAPAGNGRIEHKAREMHHANVNLMGRLPMNAGAAVGPAKSVQITVTAPVMNQVAPAIVRFNWQVFAAGRGKKMPNGGLTLSFHRV
jgi:hypothetical protein